VLFNPDTGETRAMRTKEDAADYRYFPDPDLPPLVISREWVEKVRAQLPELPEARVQRFMAGEEYKKTLRNDIETAYNQEVYGLLEYDARALVSNRAMADYFEVVAQTCGEPKLASNWIMGEVARLLNSNGMTFENNPVSATELGALIRCVKDNIISNNAARQVLEALWAYDPVVNASRRLGADSLDVVKAMIKAKGLEQINDTGELEKIIDDILAANPKNVEEFKAGNTKALNGLVGPIMKASKGKANPGQVNALLMQKLR
jgi:aspartyl-tRNA(Asn)/glutamyl-tRNA(Gln) amidotransferase subunit B